MRQSKKDDKQHLDLVEKLYSEATEQVEKEYEKERKKTRRTSKNVCDIDDGEELWNYMESSNDSIDVK